jgi:hypothetical protein
METITKPKSLMLEARLKEIYVDFGNLDCVTTDNLKPLPDALKRVRLK